MVKGGNPMSMNVSRLIDALLWRVARAGRGMRSCAAFLWRRMMFRTTFIAVSGSVGKTTTKELLRVILASHAPTTATVATVNHRKTGGPEAVLLGVRPWHRYAVIEAGVERPGDMASVIKLLKPDVGVMLDVKRCHMMMFRTMEALADEKADLVRNLRRRSRAILNLDNPYVADMADVAPCEVVGFGTGDSARVKLLEARSRWPERLTLRIAVDGEAYEVRTRLVGTHWATAVLAALTTALTCGVPLDAAIASVGQVEPFWARMQPITLPGSGAVVIRDEWNGSIDTFEAAFKVMEEASAERKILVLSDYSDTSTKLRGRANHLGRRGAGIADLLVFVGDYAERSVAAAMDEGMGKDNARAFVTMAAAAEFLRAELSAGDLLLLKGQSNHHLTRVYLALLGEVTCTTVSCSRQILCDRCPRSGMAWNPRLQTLVAAPDSRV